VSIPRQAVANAGVMSVILAGQEIVLWHRPGQRSALDDDTIRAGREIGTVSAFDPQLDGRTLSFTPLGTGFRDAQTGSTWNVLGEATAGPLKGHRLRPVTHLDTFWFAWVAFQPETRLHW
jgi:hypothetical protein